MKMLLCLGLILAGCPLALAAGCPTGQAKDEGALFQAEQRWAKALEEKDPAALACILGAEFQDAGPDGQLTDRATTLAKAGDHKAPQHQLTGMQARVYGDFGYIRGLATAVDEQGKVLVQVRFTDIYVYREGRWQAVAGHESILPVAAH